MIYKIKLLFSLLLFTVSLSAQSNKQLRKDYEKNLERLETTIQDENFIKPFPGEYPQDIEEMATRRDGTRINETNWGQLLVVPPAIEAEIRTRAKYKGYLRVSDTAGRSNHTTLQKGQKQGKNFTTDIPLDDENGHGTHCASIALGSDCGIARILVDMNLLEFELDKVLGKDGSGSFTNVAACEKALRAEDLARKNAGVWTVASYSLGGGTAKVDAVEKEFEQNQRLAGTFYVAAAGNTGGAGVQYPGNSPYCFGVAALKQNPLSRDNYSTTGPEVFVAAPGSAIKAAYLNNKYATLSGTSMATPAFAGVVCIAKAIYGPDLSDPVKARKYFQWVAQDISPDGYDTQTGYGIALVRSVLDKDPKNTPNSPTTPPNNPPTTPPTREVRDIVTDLDGQYQMFWNIVGQQQSENFAPKLLRVSQKAAASAALSRLVVTEIVVRHSTNTNDDASFDNVSTFTKTFFTNRGIALAVGSDHRDCAGWISHFYELIGLTQDPNKMSLRVERLTYKTFGADGKERTFTLSESQLRHWK